MQFDSVAEALAMSGHGGYVWFVYAVALVVIASLLLGPVRRSRRILRDERGRRHREQAISERETGYAPGT